MAWKIVFVALALLAVISAQHHQGGSHQDQGGHNQFRQRRDVSQDAVDSPQPGASWTTCDVITSPAISCHDCNTRMICKPIGGLLKPCRNPLRPYCNNGICSPVPSTGC